MTIVHTWLFFLFLLDVWIFWIEHQSLICLDIFCSTSQYYEMNNYLNIRDKWILFMQYSVRVAGPFVFKSWVILNYFFLTIKDLKLTMSGQQWCFCKILNSDSSVLAISIFNLSVTLCLSSFWYVLTFDWTLLWALCWCHFCVREFVTA